MIIIFSLYCYYCQYALLQAERTPTCIRHKRPCKFYFFPFRNFFTGITNIHSYWYVESVRSWLFCLCLLDKYIPINIVQEKKKEGKCIGASKGFPCCYSYFRSQNEVFYRIYCARNRVWRLTFFCL